MPLHNLPRTHPAGNRNRDLQPEARKLHQPHTACDGKRSYLDIAFAITVTQPGGFYLRNYQIQFFSDIPTVLPRAHSTHLKPGRGFSGGQLFAVLLCPTVHFRGGGGGRGHARTTSVRGGAGGRSDDRRTRHHNRLLLWLRYRLWLRFRPWLAWKERYGGFADC